MKNVVFILVNKVVEIMLKLWYIRYRSLTEFYRSTLSRAWERMATSLIPYSRIRDCGKGVINKGVAFFYAPRQSSSFSLSGRLKSLGARVTENTRAAATDLRTVVKPDRPGKSINLCSEFTSPFCRYLVAFPYGYLTRRIQQFKPCFWAYCVQPFPTIRRLP